MKSALLELIILLAVVQISLEGCAAGQSCTPSFSGPCIGETYSPQDFYYCLKPPPGYQVNSGKTGITSCLSPPYSDAFNGDDSCQSCPIGFKCPLLGQFQMCPKGQYSNGGSSSCSSCSSAPANPLCADCRSGPGAPYFRSIKFSYCSGTYTFICSAGFYYKKDTNNCVICNPGEYCPLNSLTPLSCPDGYYTSVSGASDCLACPDGSYCTKTGVFGSCASGDYSPKGVSSCSPIPAGAVYKKNSDKAPIYCAPGTYPDLAVENCLPCPTGSFCVGGLKATCPTGFYPDSGKTKCEPCPGGFLCSANGLGTACSSGTYLEPLTYNTVGCTDCPAGSFCPSTKSTPALCPKGTYSGLRQTTCSLCPAGSVCSAAGTSSPSSCGFNKYSRAGATACLTCPEGFKCPGSGAIIPCPAGRSSLSGALDCIASVTPKVSPTGHATNDRNCLGTATANPTNTDCTYDDTSATSTTSGKCVPAAGEYITSTYECLPCGAGNACPDPYHKPIVCPFGTFSAADDTSITVSIRATLCKTCPAGYSCVDSKTNPVACLAGTFSTANSTSCTSCPRGKYCPVTDAPIVIDCDTGYYAPDIKATQCILCPKDNECINKIAARPCPPNYYSFEGWGVCRPCPPGRACYSGVTRFNPPQYCPQGTYSFEGDNFCRDCPPGTYCLEGSTAPSPCGPGTYSNAPKVTTCASCPSGTYSHVGATTCSSCPIGSYCINHASIPIPCGLGTFTSMINQISCSPCDPGFVCSMGSTSAISDKCPRGYYCPHPLGGDLSILPCSAGTYGIIEGAKVNTECASCPAGYYCPFAGMDSPILCPEGSYCSSNTIYPTPCIAGKYNMLKGNSDPTKCLDCPAGNYCPGGTIEPIPCAGGHFCPLGSASRNANPCPAGTYTSSAPAQSSGDCIVCPKGYYCEIASSAPTPCPAGTYGLIVRATSLIDCKDCASGTTCITVGSTTGDGVTCQPGYYCTDKTTNSKEHPCPNNTFSDISGAKTLAACLKCPAGYVCTEGTNRYTNPKKKCPKGYYCEEGEYPQPCPAGKYQPYFGIDNVLLCSFLCPPGKYCLQGSASPTGDCPAGYYCPEGTQIGEANPCPEGTYSFATGLKSADECTICPAGHYCTNMIDIIPCPEGTFNPEVGKGISGCRSCDAGYKCPNPKTVNEEFCGLGFYSVGGTTDCEQCPALHFCNTQNTTEIQMKVQLCGPGYLCDNKTGEFPAEGLLCPEGHYCNGTYVFKFPCPPGTYGPTRGIKFERDCIPTPAGMYSLRGSIRPTGECDPGFYCKQSSEIAQANECPAGTFRSLPGGAKADDCGVCPAGYYCPSGTSDPRKCPTGYYCGPGCTEPVKCPYGTFGASPLLRDVTHCTKCWSGRFCSVPGLTAPDGECDPGFYCISGSFVPNPTDGTTGKECDAGGYCPAGSKTPQPCNPGTYLPTPGAKSDTECLSCPPKYYCVGEVRNTVTGPCAPGYYCSGGAKSQFETPAPPGSFSPGEVDAPLDCPAGTYTVDEGSVSCIDCPAGYYCPGPRNDGNIVDCPAGSFCEKKSGAPSPCAPGTFSPTLNLHNQGECLPCTPGKYCTGGLSAPDNDCAAGFYCIPGSSSSTQNKCKKGAYCTPGSSYPTLCPLGTYNDQEGRLSLSDCNACTAGYYCGSTGLEAPEGQCDEGYYCHTRETSPRPSGKRCKEGEMCPKGSPAPLPCPAGTYQDSFVQAKCIPCPRGYYCAANCVGFIDNCLTNPCVASHSIIQDCSAGHYCVEGTPTEISCAPGTFNDKTNAFDSSLCTPCTPGYFCPNSAMTSVPPANQCNAGYYCTRGATSATQAMCPIGYYCPQGSAYPVPCTPGEACISAGLAATSGSCNPGYYCTLKATLKTPTTAAQGGGKCPPGFYCISGAIQPVPCPPGTYSTAAGGVNLASCTPCTSGTYCNDLAGITSKGACAPGYYCISPNGYSTDRPTSQICPKGYFCTQGINDKAPCPSSDYQDLEGQSTCKNCPGGYMCTDTTITLCAPKTSNKAFYCPDLQRNSKPCPDGTFNYQEKTMSLADCTTCPPGKYCDPTSSVSQINTCPAGFYCSGGTGGLSGSHPPIQCTISHYCPAGVEAERDCPPGYFCNTPGLADYSANKCSKGFYCKIKSISASPIGSECSLGHYCPEATPEEIPCPPGTYRDAIRGESVADCTICPAGVYCGERGLTHPGVSCPTGYYCPQGTAQGTKFPCEPGYKCPTNSPAQIPCPNNFYQPLPVKDDCLPCPDRYLCKQTSPPATIVGAIKPEICPSGYYCTINQSPMKCPAGTYSDMTGLGLVTECTPCPRGKVCSLDGLTAPDRLCDPGYYCKEGAAIGNPTDGIKGEVCPVGYYCDAAVSAIPIPCPPGTYSDATGKTIPGDCSPCKAQYFCPYQGGTSAIYKFGIDGEFFCSEGYLCISGCSTPTPTDMIKGRPCSTGNYCGKGANSETPCTPNTFNPYTGQKQCYPCPAGRNCPTSGLIMFQDCIQGHYCEEGLAPKPCPAGRYGPSTKAATPADCYKCDPGKYCLGGSALVTGDCDPGYVCPRGAKSKSDPTKFFTFAAYENEGLCPAGYYCGAGSKAPMPCPIGEYQDQVGMTACKPCPTGRYCDVPGIANPSGKLCEAGYFCDSGAKTSTPSGTEGWLCKAGHYCPSGTLREEPCMAGTYEPRTGAKATCQNCPAGYYCPTGTIAPIECPLKSFCIAGSSSPTVCLDGTYSNVPGLQSAEQCRQCPSGKYCQNGGIVGICDAGFYCDAGAKLPGEIAKSCPAGHYCTPGCQTPTLCANGKVNPNTGGKTQADCKDCDAGFYCIATVSTPYVCPEGNYCPSSSSSPTPCAAGYYSNQLQRTSSNDCKLCPPGYNCTGTGTASLNDVKCPIGYYCPDSLQPPIPCPAATYSADYGLFDVSQCLICKAGYYCIERTVTPILCGEGMTCPPGSSKQSPCPAGYYCKYWNVGGYSVPLQRPCPGGFYCPVKTVIPIKCENGYYCPSSLCADGTVCTPESATPCSNNCPPGSDKPIPCPGGYMGSGSTHNDALETGCFKCPPGSYSLTTDGTDSKCYPCPAGYVCVKSTSSAKPIDPDRDGGYECPKGYYCPEASYEPTPCAAGYFNNEKISKSVESCYQCEVNTYTDVPGQAGCKPCGPTSEATMGATICKCRGENRVFQKSDGKCVCKQYYTSVLDNDEEDSNYDCRPLLHDRCSSGLLRDSLGNCVPQDDCQKDCKGNTGKRSPGIGLCECDSIQDPDTVCNYNCRSSATKIIINQKGYMTFADGSTIDLRKLTDAFGEPSCEIGNCNLVSMTMNPSNGFIGTYGPSQKLLNAARNLGAITEKQQRRMLQSSTNGIDNPIVCISLGDTVSFSVSSTNYPVYLINAMANSNPQFDYTKFTQLGQDIQSGDPISIFFYTFTQPGVYVFGDAADLSQQTVISVMQASETCGDTDKYIVPITLSNLLKMGVVQNEEITLSPDWVFIGVVFIVILILIPGIIMFISYLHNRALENKKLAAISFGRKADEIKSVTARVCPQNTKHVTEEGLVNKDGHVIDLKNEEDGEIDPTIFDDIYGQLKSHVAYVKSEFDKKYGQDKENIAKVWDQMKILKKFIKMKLKAIAKIFGKNLKYMLNTTAKQKHKEEVKEEKSSLDAEEGPEVIEEEGYTAEADKAMFKEAMDTRLAGDAQELNNLKEEGEKNSQEFMKKFVSEENKRLEDFKERILESSDLTETDKKGLMKEYETQLQKLQKQLLLDQNEATSHIKLCLEERKARREQLLAQKRVIDSEKELIKRKNSTLLEDVNNSLKNDEKSIDAEIDANLAASKSEMENRRMEDADKLKAKFDEQLKKTSSGQKRVQIMEEYRQASKTLEEEYEQQKAAQFAEFTKKLEERRKQLKEEARNRRKEERDGIILQCQKELDQIKVSENVIYNKLVNVAIEEKVKEAKDTVAPEAAEGKVKLKKLKQTHNEEFDKLEVKEKNILSTISEEEAKDNEAIKAEVEKRKAQVIHKTRKNCSTLNEKRKKLTKEMDSPLTVEARKNELQKELQAIDEEIKNRIESELLKQDMELTKLIDARRRKRIAQEIDLKRNINEERLEMDEKCTNEEEVLKADITEQNFKRALEQLKGRMSAEEYPVALEKLLEEKHMGQLSNLLAVQYKQKAKIMSTKMGELIDQKLMEMHKVKEDLEKEYNRVKAAKESNSISDADYERRLKDIQERERDRLRNIELNYIQKGNELEEEIYKKLGDKNQQELLKLRETQLNEKSAFIGQLAENNRSAKAILNSGPKDMVSKELEEYRNQLSDEYQRKLKELENRKRRLEEIALENEDKIKEFNENTKRLLDEFAKREKEKLERKRADLEKQKQQHEASLKGISEVDKQKLLEEYNQQFENLRTLMEAEQKRQAEKMMKKMEERWKTKEKLKNQKEMQLLMYRREVDDKLDSRLEEMKVKLEVKVEAADINKKMEMLASKTDRLRNVFYKKKLIAGAEVAKELQKIDTRVLLEQNLKFDDEDEFTGTLLDIDFDGLLRDVDTMKQTVSSFTDKNFSRLIEGFRTINTQLNDLKSRALSKKG